MVLVYHYRFIDFYGIVSRFSVESDARSIRTCAIQKKGITMGVAYSPVASATEAPQTVMGTVRGMDIEKWLCYMTGDREIGPASGVSESSHSKPNNSYLSLLKKRQVVRVNVRGVPQDIEVPADAELVIYRKRTEQSIENGWVGNPSLIWAAIFFKDQRRSVQLTIRMDGRGSILEH